MKTYFTLLLITLVSLASCKKDNHSDALQEIPITFSLSGFETNITSFPKLGASVKEVGDTLRNYAKYLDCIIYDANENPIKVISQDYTSSDFGKITTNLLPGNYTAVFLAAPNKNRLSLEGQSLSQTYVKFFSPDDEDIFLAKLNISVSNNPVNQKVRLERLVGGIEVTIEDALPVKANKIEIRIQHEPTLHNIVTNTQSRYLTKVKDFPIPADKIGQTNTKYFLHVLNTETPVNVEVSCWRKIDGGPDPLVLAKKTISNVRVYRNEVTRLSGSLFTP